MNWINLAQATLPNPGQFRNESVSALFQRAADVAGFRTRNKKNLQLQTCYVSTRKSFALPPDTDRGR
ncbi:hypothetical protein ACVJGD_008549 [Bradyrhizobium sp. USDA 10063]